MATLGQVIKSPSDNRTYKALKLSNQLECVLIHDIDAMKSSAALSMAVGSFRDPTTAQGLAHYLEHMLFMGTAKYPDENDYSNFITKNGGSNNAYTSQEQTNYMLEVSSAAFQPALDRFAQFFISPLMKQQSAQKQIQAVHSQHQKNILNDAWRRYQLSKQIAKTGHPFNKFSTGDKTTLMCQNLQQLLHQFYKDNYSSNLMKLVIYGNQPIQTLQKWAIQKFSEIPNKKLKKYSIQQQPYDKKAFGKLFKIVPIKDIRRMQITWILPFKKAHYRNHPGTYISNLIGHEGKGSILSYLMKEGLATSLSSGNSDNYDCYTDFTITLDLTEKGLTNYHQIIGYILFYIKMLKQKQCPQWFFQELQLVNKLKFQFMDKRKGMSQTSKIAKNMQQRKVEQLMIYPYLMQEWKPQLIKQYLSELTQDNMIVFLQAKRFQPQCNLEEPVYKSKYSSQDLKSVQPLQCDVDLPERNIFLPKDLSMLPLANEKLPQLIYQTKFIDTFFKEDHVFALPKINVNFRFNFLGNCTVVQQIGRALLLQMFKQSLRQFTYLSEMAEIETQISFVSNYALDIKFKGFKDSLKIYIVQYLQKLFSFVPNDKQYFDTLIEKHRRRYANYFLSDPYRLVYEKNAAAIRTNSSTSEEDKLIEIDNVVLEDVVALNRSWKKRVFLDSYIAGNITKQESKGIAEQVEKFLISHSRPLQPSQCGQMRPVWLPSSQISVIQRQLKNPSQENSSSLVSFQTGQLTIRSQMLLKILQSVSKQPAFDYLRTKQQLGYIVYCLAEDHRGVGALTIIVQSSVKSSYEVVTFVNNFININLREIVEGLSQEQFAVFKNAIIQSKTEKDKNLAAQSVRYWGQIVKHKYIFNRKQQELSALASITLQQFKEFVKQHLYSEPRIIQLHMTSKNKAELNENVKSQRLTQTQAQNQNKEGKETLAIKRKINIYKSVEQFQRKALLYPDFYAPNNR